MSKRTLEQVTTSYDDVVLIDDFSDEEDEEILFSDNENTPPRKRVRGSLAFERTSFCASLRITTQTKNCYAQFTLCDASYLSNVPNQLRTSLFANIDQDISLRILDFASADTLHYFRDAESGSMRSDITQLSITGKDENSRCMLAYLRGLLARKNEIAIVPVENSEYQLLVYFEESNVDSFEALDFFSTSLSCLLVKRFNMVLDLDETLIRTRIPRDANDRPLNKLEYEFFVQGNRYITVVRPGVDMILRWACQIFKVVIFTNAIREYAIEIAKILDPTREHLLAGQVNWEQLIKSRESMVPVQHIPRPQGLKVLEKFGIEPRTSVVFDDDNNVWSKTNQDCIVPFEQVTSAKKPSDLFCNMRTETWKRLAYMHKLDYNTRKKQMTAEKPTFSQEHVMQQLENTKLDGMNVEETFVHEN